MLYFFRWKWVVRLDNLLNGQNTQWVADLRWTLQPFQFTRQSQRWFSFLTKSTIQGNSKRASKEARIKKDEKSGNISRIFDRPLKTHENISWSFTAYSCPEISNVDKQSRWLYANYSQHNYWCNALHDLLVLPHHCISEWDGLTELQINSPTYFWEMKKQFQIISAIFLQLRELFPIFNCFYEEHLSC